VNRAKREKRRRFCSFDRSGKKMTSTAHKPRRRRRSFEKKKKTLASSFLSFVLSFVLSEMNMLSRRQGRVQSSSSVPCCPRRVVITAAAPRPPPRKNLEENDNDESEFFFGDAIKKGKRLVGAPLAGYFLFHPPAMRRDFTCLKIEGKKKGNTYIKKAKGRG
jgi:hypothetical protein